MHDTKTLYRLAVQMYICEQEDKEMDTPTIEEVKAVIDKRLAQMEAAQDGGETFIISTDDVNTEKVEVKQYLDSIEIASIMEDTKTGIIYSENKIELSRDEFKRIAQYITDTF